MVRIEDVTNTPEEGRQGQGNGSSRNVRRRNVDLDDLNIDDSKLPPKKSVVGPATVSTVSRQSAKDESNEGEGEGEEESEDEESTALVEGEVASPPELSFDEQVDAARAQMQPTPMEKFMAICKSLILRAMVIYFVMYFLRGGGSSKHTITNSTSVGASSVAPASLASTNIYNNGTIFDMYVYISEDKEPLLDFNKANLIWVQERIIYGDWTSGPNSDGSLVHDVDIALSKKIQNNGSLYIHSYIVPEGFSPDSSKVKYDKDRTIYSNKMLNKFKKKKYSQTLNLLTGQSSQSEEDQEKAKTMKSEIISHWHPNLTLGFVTDFTAWTMGAVPSPLNEYIKFLPKELKYQPVLFYNDYWNLMKEYQPINSTVKKIHLTLTYQPLSLFKWQIYAAQSMRNQWQTNLFAGGGEIDDEEDQDTLKETILGTNPYLLFLTFAVSLLHSVFEFLAFKNDIQFWNNRKSLEGLSVRSVFFNVFQSLIVLLYILDNETNFVIKVSVFIGLLIEVWKINKVTDVTIDRENLILGFIPRIKISDKGSYVESSTRKYDILAFRYLSWVLFPLIVGYAIYSIVYHEHKSWYSWVLSMAYGFLLTFGFIMMTPQLFINYKLKSVAHLPWKMLSYKFLNTFIDDIFAFVIKMPTMYRIGCLRDDVIFFVYLYQRYIYRIDPTRVNEFGFSAEMLENKDKQLAVSPDGSGSAITETNIANPSTSISNSSTEPKPKPVSKKTKSKKEKKVQ